MFNLIVCLAGNKLAKHLATNGCMSAYPSKEEARKAKLVVDGEEEEAMEEAMDEEVMDKEVMDEEVGQEKRADEEKDDQQKREEEEEAFKKQCKTSPRKEEREKPSHEKTIEEEESKSEVANEGKDKKKKAHEEVKDNPSEKEKILEDEETPKSGGMLLFGTLFKYMDKEKEEGTEKSAEEAKQDDADAGSVDEKVEPVKESKSGEFPEPDLTTPPPPPQEEMDTA